MVGMTSIIPRIDASMEIHKESRNQDSFISLYYLKENSFRDYNRKYGSTNLSRRYKFIRRRAGLVSRVQSRQSTRANPRTSGSPGGSNRNTSGCSIRRPN